MSANYKSTEAAFDVSDARRSIMNQMAKGFMIAMVTFFGPVVFILVIYWIGLLLPPESKEADDPTPDSFPIVMEAAEEPAEEEAATE
ncbi:MAG: RC-LH1 core complex protein PufX [Pseudomonadota bacterium]